MGGSFWNGSAASWRSRKGDPGFWMTENDKTGAVRGGQLHLLDVLDRDLTKAAVGLQGDRGGVGRIGMADGLDTGEGGASVALDKVSTGDHQEKLAEAAIGGQEAAVGDLIDTGEV